MNPLETILQALGSIGQGTPASAQGIQQEQLANRQLNQPGTVTVGDQKVSFPPSVMGSERQGQLLGQQSPLLATISQLVNSLNPIDWMGGMQGAEQALPALGGRFFHGTPNVFKEFDPAVSKASGLVGPGIAYLTDNPKVAETYAQGVTHGIQGLGDISPNIRPYAVQNFNAFKTSQSLPQTDLDALTRSILTSLGESSGGFQKGSQVNRAQNVVNAIRPQADSGQAVFDTLQSMLGPERTNQVLKNAGFQAIEYPGGAIMGDTPHRAINVLDPSIMQNLFEVLAGSGGVAK